MELTIPVVVIAVVATLVGATIQGAIGFGMNLITVPVLALVLPESLPVAVILLGIPISLTMLHYERHALDAGLGWIIAGRVPGTMAGALVVAVVSTTVLQAVVGGVVLVLALASVTAPALPVRANTQFVAGAVSGLTGTAAGIGGPPLALLYQHRAGATMRSTLAASFLFGTVLSLAALGVAGQIEVAESMLGLGLAPVVVAGSVAGRRLHDLLDRGWLRPAVIAFAVAAAIVVIADAIS